MIPWLGDGSVSMNGFTPATLDTQSLDWPGAPVSGTGRYATVDFYLVGNADAPVDHDQEHLDSWSAALSLTDAALQ